MFTAQMTDLNTKNVYIFAHRQPILVLSNQVLSDYNLLLKFEKNDLYVHEMGRKS